MSETLSWFAFAARTGTQVHDLLRLRQDVFVVEQDCAFAEIDGNDPDADHLLVSWPGVGTGAGAGDLVGCLRITRKDADLRIGRVVVGARARGSGLGHRMMASALARCGQTDPGRAVMLSAQAHLQGFYAAHGFIASSATYLEDGIAHVDMRRSA